MEIFNSLALFTIGFFILVKGAQILVRGAVSIASIFQVSTWLIGTVIVSIGTSIPELSINIASVFSGNDVGIATIIGSNIFNVLVVLGFMAIFSPIIMKSSWVKKDLVIFIGFTIVTGIFILLPILGDSSFNGITRIEGIVLLSSFFAWLIYMFSRWNGEAEKLDFQLVTLFTGFLMIIGGILGVFVGGRWIVDGAITIATLIGVGPSVIGFTIVALGTSLPEFVVSVVALTRGAVGIAVGNIIGSSIFNFLGVLGVTSFIKPIEVFDNLNFDIFFVVGVSILLLILMYTGKRYTLSRFEGLLFISLYTLYVVSLFVR